MRAFFINHSAASDHLGGSELSLLQLIEDWGRIDDDFEPVIVSPSKKGAFAEEVFRRHWRLKSIGYGGWALTERPGGRPEATVRIHRDARATRQIIEWMREEDPSLVVTNTLVAPWGAFAAAAVGVPHAWFVREFGDTSDGYHFPLGRENTLRDIGALSAHVFANSNAVRDALLPYIPPEKVSVAYPRVDVAEVRALALEPLPMDPFPADSDLKAVVVGRITRPKGQWRVVEAVGRLAKRGIRIAVCFVGATVEGNADVALRGRAAKLGIADLVTFAGEQRNPFPFVRAADVGIVASKREAFGRVTIECLLLGRPVVATRSGGSPELVAHGRTGFLTAPDSTEELSAYLERYATDPELLRRHQDAAANVAEGVLASGATADEVVETLRAASAQAVSPLPSALVALWRLPEVLVTSRVERVDRVVRIRTFVRRIARISRDPLGSYRRWRLRRRAGTV